jgi:hypothetical protein
MSRLRGILILTAAVAASAALIAPAQGAGSISTSGAIHTDDQPPSSEPAPPADAVETAADQTAGAISDWIAANPNSAQGGVRVNDDLVGVTVYWKGTAPSELRNLAKKQPAPVTFVSSRYSASEVMTKAQAIAANYPDWVSTASGRIDYSGLSVTMTSSAPPDAFLQIAGGGCGGAAPSGASSTTCTTGDGTPITNEGAMDLEATARYNDFFPFFGGALIKQPSTGAVCGTGVAGHIVATGEQVVTTAWHCGTGYWTSWSGNHGLGSVGPRNYHLDIQMVKTLGSARVWTGSWDSLSTRGVAGWRTPGINTRVWLEGSLSGKSHDPYGTYVRSSYTYANIAGIPGPVGPGFHTGSGRCPYRCWYQGIARRGDSGSPIVTYTKDGKVLIVGLLSAGAGLSYFCQSGQNPSFPVNPCYGGVFAVYPTWALGSLGATLNVW